MVTENEIYRSTHTDDLFRVTAAPDPFANLHPDQQTVEFARLDDGEIYSDNLTTFRKGFRRVADSEEDL